MFNLNRWDLTVFFQEYQPGGTGKRCWHYGGDLWDAFGSCRSKAVLEMIEIAFSASAKKKTPDIWGPWGSLIRGLWSASGIFNRRISSQKRPMSKHGYIYSAVILWMRKVGLSHCQSAVEQHVDDWRWEAVLNQIFQKNNPGGDFHKERPPKYASTSEVSLNTQYSVTQNYIHWGWGSVNADYNICHICKVNVGAGVIHISSTGDSQKTI